MATFNTAAPSPWRQAPEVIYGPAPSVPRNSFAEPIYPRPASMRPPMGRALPVSTQVQNEQLNYLLEAMKLDNQVQKLFRLRITELSNQLKAQIGEARAGLCTLEKYLPTHKGKPLLRGISHVLLGTAEATNRIRMHLKEADCYSGMRSQQNDLYTKFSQFVTTMGSQIPTNPWLPFEPEIYEASFSEQASAYEQEQEDPEVIESSASSGPSSPTFGSGCRGLGEALSSERSETVHSELRTSGETLTSIPGENQKSATTSLPAIKGHLASGEVQDDLSHRLLLSLTAYESASSHHRLSSQRLPQEAKTEGLCQFLEALCEVLCKRYPELSRTGTQLLHELRESGGEALEVLQKTVKTSNGNELTRLHLADQPCTTEDKHLKPSEDQLVDSFISFGLYLGRLGYWYAAHEDNSSCTEINLKLGNWSKRQEEGNGCPDSMNPPGYARTSSCDSRPSAEDMEDFIEVDILSDGEDLL